MKRSLTLILCFAGAAFLVHEALACSRVVWNDNGEAIVIGRSLDWQTPIETDLYALPRGLEKNGLTGRNTLTWTAKYGNVVATSGDGKVGSAIDGINEKGLSVSALWLSDSDYGAYDPERKSLSLGLWGQYYLDNFATVGEATDFTEKTPFELVTGEFQGEKIVLHLAVTDPSGETAIIEYLDGKPKIHRGKQFTVMTNEPPYDRQLSGLAQYTGFGGDKPIPGDSDPVSRFVRGTYYLDALSRPSNYRETIAGVLSVIRAMSVPLGDSEDPKHPNIAATRWRVVSDLTNRVYFFESSTSPNLVWVNLDNLDFSEGSGIRKLDLTNNPDRIGDVTKEFEPAEMVKQISPDLNAATGTSSGAGGQN